MPSEKQIEVVCSKVYGDLGWVIDNIDDCEEVVRAVLTAAEQAEPAPAARSGAVKAILELVQYHVTDDDDRASLTTAISALEPAEPATDVEPVAWMLRDKGDGNRWLYFKEHDAAAQQRPCHDMVPLFTHPPESRLREAAREAVNCITHHAEDNENTRWVLSLLNSALAQEDGR